MYQLSSQIRFRTLAIESPKLVPRLNMSFTTPLLGKRHRSPSPSPSPSSPSWKRLKTSTASYAIPHTLDDPDPPTFTTASLTPYQDQSFHSPEIFLHILSFLEVKDLVMIERVNGYWKRMAGDGSLWRRLYLGTLLSRTAMPTIVMKKLNPTCSHYLCLDPSKTASFPYPSTHHLRAHTYTSRRPLLRTQTSSRSLRRDASGPSPALTPLRRASLPISAPAEEPLRSEASRGSAMPPDAEPSHNKSSRTQLEELNTQEEPEIFDEHHQIDWKTLLKIGTNWSTGNASLHSLSPSPSPAPATARRLFGETGSGGDVGGIGGGVGVESPLRGRGRERGGGVELGGRGMMSDGGGGMEAEYRPLLGGRSSRTTNNPLPPTSANPASSTMSDPPAPTATTVHQTHPQAKVPQHLLTLAGPFILVAYPDSPLLHVYSSYPTSNISNSTSKNGPPNSGDNTDTGPGGESLPVCEIGPGTSFSLGALRTGGSTLTPSDKDRDNEPPNQPISLIPPPPGWSNPSHPDLITAIAVDDRSHSSSHPHLPSVNDAAIRVAIFYASGGFAIISLTSSSNPSSTPHPHRNTCNWSRKVAHTPPEMLRRRSRKRHFIPPLSERIVLAGMVDDFLVGISGGFYINIWNLKGEVKLVQTLHSSVAHWPACLDVRAVEEEQESAGAEGTDDGMTDDGRLLEEVEDRKYQVRLGYCTPLYPISWKPSIQEISVDLSTAKPDITISDPIEVIRKTRSFITPSGGLQKVRGEIVGVKGDGILGPKIMAMDERWLVLAGRDNLVEVYDIAAPTSTSVSLPKKGAGVHHSQTLLAHASAITSVALRHDRCVTAGNDGRVLVWQLDQGPSVLATDDFNDHAIFESSKVMGGESYHVEIRNRLPGEIAFTSDGQPSLNDIADLITLRQRVLPIPPVTHPLSLASAAKELFFLTPRRGQLADIEARRRTRVRGLAFNEETIVGLVNGQAEGGMVRVWKFDA